ncbi:MAG: ribose-5-phosphate isomerase RpiA [SAR324 cluster bacterium]|nr:ribose-5-phosphate isomerase RpiA [SAR324 cluster bacterium]
MSRDSEKQLAAEAAAELVTSGQTVGLGTGSTAAFAVRKLGQRVRGGLSMLGIPTSESTRSLAEAEGIPLTTFAETTTIDITLDGADEFDGGLNLIKGGGGALFREKIVASASRRLVIFADASKRVERLGRFPLPVEVTPFGWQVAAARIEELGAGVSLRGGADAPFLTDNHGYVLDCAFGEIRDPAALEARLRAIVGVTVTGLFVGMAETVFMAEGETVHTFRPA